MPVFTAIAAGATALAGAIGFSAAAAGIAGSVAAFAARTLLTVGLTKLMVNKAGQSGAGTSNAGSRVQLPPATDNKLPVIYGSAFIGGSITDAKISTDQKTMWYVVALADVTDSTPGSAYTFGNIYYDNKLVTFGTGGDAAKVVSLTTNTTGTPEVDTKIDGNLFIYLFTNGSNSGVNTGGQTAINIMSDAAIPSDQRWNQGIYTASGQSATMTNTAFAIVKVIYNQDAGTTNLGSLTVQLQNSLYQPGAVIKDYLSNARYGCAVPASKINSASLAALDAYSAQTITYVPVGGGSATQARYRIDGPLNTGQNCLNNLQQLVDSCDSWLQYSEMSGEWKVVINQSYTDYTTLGQLYEVDSSNLIGGVEVNPLDLNGTFNIVEVQYPNYNIKDQTDFQTISLFTSYPSLLSPNEPVNKLNVQFPQVNNAVQAKYLALRRLFQAREDLVVSFATDYSGIQVEAGDVIKITLEQYGWTDKLFRVTFVGEQKYPDGSLGATMTAFEYNDTVYDDNLVQDFIPASNTGLSDPNIIGTPNAPTVINSPVNDGTNASQFITGIVPTPGAVLYMDFNYGTTSDVKTHIRYTTTTLGGGQLYTAGNSVQIEMSDLPSGTYYWSVTARNNSAGVTSLATLSPAWNGPSVKEYTEVTKTPVTSSGAQLTVPDTGGLLVGQTVTIASGTGAVPSGTVIVSIDSSIFITISNTPTTPIASASVTFSGGGITGTNIQNGTITITQMGPGFSQLSGYTSWLQTTNSFADLTTGVYNVPSYLVGTTVSSSEYFPWAQGTATTAMGYVNNSTGNFEPFDARRFVAPNGTDNWWIVGSATFVPAAIRLSRQINLKMVADTDTVVQVMSGRFGTPPSTNFISITTFTTVYLNANLPQTVNVFDQNITGTGTDTVGFMVRNMVSGTTVYFYDGDVFGFKNS
jgi:hypothetical protein